jgi:hypothetical protein
MLDPGGYSGTDWSTAEVIDMWLAISNQDTTSHWEVVEGWRKSSQLTDQHLQAVKNYRKNLIDAWPPEKSAASAAYVKRLDDLIDHLQQTFDAATANLDAFRSATLAIGDARTNLGKIVDEYYTNEAALRTFNESKSQRTPGQGNYKLPEPKPPVPDGRQEQLASQARSIMYGLGHELTTAQTQIVDPEAYDPTYGMGDDKRQYGGTTYSAPGIPEVVPFDPHTSSASISGGTASHMSPTHADSPTTGPPSTSPGSIRQPGLILGGMDPHAVVAPSGIPYPLPTPITGRLSMPNVITPPPPFAPDFVGLPSTAPTSLGPGRSLFGNGFGGPGAGRSSSVQAMPPGGVIGGQPGVGLGQPGTGGRAMQRISPAGGLLNAAGSPPARTGAGSRVASAYGQPSGTAQGRNISRHDKPDDSTQWDPDNPWKIAEGVDPVVFAARDPRIDPGPAIGLN